VRLKAEAMKQLNELFKISIPFGAIKSYENKKKEKRRFIISIPFGAIKRNTEFKKILILGNFNSFWCD